MLIWEDVVFIICALVAVSGAVIFAHGVRLGHAVGGSHDNALRAPAPRGWLTAAFIIWSADILFVLLATSG